MYSQGFYITDNASNNAFSYEIRRDPKLFVAPLIEGGINDVKVGDKIAFEDIDDEGNLRSCVGLKNFVHFFLSDDTSVYIFDNHNHAFYFWHKERNSGRIKNGTTLIHIDQHKDTRKPDDDLSSDDSRNPVRLFSFTNTVLNVGNFIPAATATGITGTVINVDSEQSMQNFNYSILEKGNVIVDIDLDFFAPALDYIALESKISFCQKCIQHANTVTIASSPFFIEQKLAITRLKQLLRPYLP